MSQACESRRSLSPALEKVSPLIGAELIYNVLTHDDGVDALGGESCLTTGSMGSGKTTMEIQITAASRHVTGPYSKEQARNMEGIFSPETAIWRGRKYDYWTVFLTENWERSFPGAYHKPLRIHIQEGSGLRFYTHQDRIEYLDLDDQIYTYRTVNDAWHNLKRGGINVFYEPPEYALSSKMVYNLLKSQLKEIFPEKECPQKPAPSQIWWFEFIGHILETKKRKEWLTILMDEAHQVFPSNCSGDHWWLIAAFANQVIDMRRHNITFCPATQDANLIDYRITDRMTHFIWLPGSKPVERRSRVNRKLIGCLRKGTGIIEKSNERFGRFDFGRIPQQPPVVQVDGLPSFM